MADVFLSYARAERSRALAVRNALVKLNLSVFFDIDGIDGGDDFPAVLDREVKAARVVLGLWSPYALTRPWVRAECDIGRTRGVLVPVAVAPLEPMQIPASFWNLHYMDLTRFNGRVHDPDFANVVRTIGRLLGRQDLADYMRGTDARAPQSPAPVAPHPTAERPVRRWPLFLALGLVVTAIAGSLIYLRSTPPAASSEEAPVAAAGRSLPGSEPEPLPSIDEEISAPDKARTAAVAKLQEALNQAGFEAGNADGAADEALRTALTEAAEWRYWLGDPPPDLTTATPEIIEEYARAIRAFSAQDYPRALPPADPAAGTDLPPPICPSEVLWISFETDSAALDSKAKRGARVLFEKSRNPPCVISEIAVRGFDELTEGDFNMPSTVMAWRRARAVRGFLVSLGLPDELVTVTGTSAAPTVAIEPARSLDRRVEVHVYYTGPRIR